MTIQLLRCSGGKLFALSGPGDYRQRFRNWAVALSSTGGAVVCSSWLPASVWCVVGGEARIGRGGNFETVRDDDVLVLEAGVDVSCMSTPDDRSARHRVIGLLLPPGYVPAAEISGHPPAPPFDAIEACHRGALAVKHRLLALAGGLEDSSAPILQAEIELAAVMRGLQREQRCFEPWLSRCPGRSDRHRRDHLKRLLRARRLIEGSPGLDLALHSLARTANLSPAHFQRAFVRVFGQSPHVYATHRRLTLARELLLGSELGVGQIGERVGFPNRSAFARVFRDHFGVCPTMLRRAQWRGGAALRPSGPSISQAVLRQSTPAAAVPGETEAVGLHAQ